MLDNLEYDADKDLDSSYDELVNWCEHLSKTKLSKFKKKIFPQRLCQNPVYGEHYISVIFDSLVLLTDIMLGVMDCIEMVANTIFFIVNTSFTIRLL